MGYSLYCICLKLLNLLDFDAVQSDYINKTMFAKITNENTWNSLLEMIEKGEKYLDDHNMEKIIIY